MKKLFLVISAFALVFSSCSTSSADPDPVPPVTPASSVLLSKIITTAPNTSGIVTTTTENFTYNGNKLISIISTDGNSEKFYYTGNIITKIELYYGTILLTRTIYNYNASGKLISLIDVAFNPFHDGVNIGYKQDFTYLANGDITYISYNGNETTQTTISDTGKYFFTNSEVTKYEIYHIAMVGTPAFTSTENRTYDIKNNAYKNITGMSEIAFVEGNGDFSLHNLLSYTYYKGTTMSSNGLATYSYNSSDYPISANRTINQYGSSPSVDTTSSQYFY